MNQADCEQPLVDVGRLQLLAYQVEVIMNLNSHVFGREGTWMLEDLSELKSAKYSWQRRGTLDRMYRTYAFLLPVGALGTMLRMTF